MRVNGAMPLPGQSRPELLVALLALLFAAGCGAQEPFNFRDTLCDQAALTCGWAPNGPVTQRCRPTSETEEIPCVVPGSPVAAAAARDKRILEEFKSSMTFVGPRDIEDPFATWSSNITHCVWRGVVCIGGRVVVLEAEDQWLAGPLPEYFSGLEMLTVLDLRSNILTGSLPASYSALSHLQLLRLNRNALAGTLPPQLSTLRNLTALDVRDQDDLRGPLPPEYSMMTNLKFIDLPNQITGTLPPQWSTMTNLLFIQADRGFIEGTLPAEFSQWRRIRILELNDNLLSGTLPAEWSTYTNVLTISLGGNRLATELPPQWSTLGGSLQHINLAGTKLLGALPEEWSSLTMLRMFSLEPDDVLCPTDDTSLLQNLPQNLKVALLNTYFDDPCPRESTASNTAMIAIIAVFCCLAGLLLLIPVVCGIAVLYHRRTCHDSSCPHTHPGFVHWLAGHWGGMHLYTASGCKWCAAWNGVPDLQVDYKELEPYMIDKNYVASGSFGRIYRGQFRGQDVAIKELMTGGDDAALDAFKEEVDAHFRYNESPAFVHLLGASLQPPRLFLITEFMTGGTLDDRIHKSENPLTYIETLHIARQIAEGLDLLHPTYVHRDLKPANILLDDQGNAKITDLGLAHRAGNALDTQMATDAAGTAAYMSPEQHDGAFTTKIDIYALGIIMNECLTKELPFINYKGSVAVAIAVVERQERPQVAVNIPPRMQKLIRLTWSSDPMQRPSAAELVIMLDSLIQEEAVHRIDPSSHGGASNLASVSESFDGSELEVPLKSGQRPYDSAPAELSAKDM